MRDSIHLRDQRSGADVELFFNPPVESHEAHSLAIAALKEDARYKAQEAKDFEDKRVGDLTVAELRRILRESQGKP